jgi:hypothetical protein
MFSIPSHFRCLCVLALLVLGTFALPKLWAGDESVNVDVSDSTTYVNLAKVNLSVGTMSFDDGKLLGTYSIQVPMLKSKSETGRIVLSLLQGVDVYARDGGSISGEGIVEGNQGERRKIDVHFSPCDSETKEGRIDLKIDTGARILEFKSTYQLSGEGLLVMN